MEQQNLPSQETQNILKEIESTPAVEDKIKLAIESMRKFLSQEKAANLKAFWEVRKACLPFFKETLAQAAREQLWTDFIELTREGRKLKSLHDEESAFAAEQIELATTALEEELQGFQTHRDEILEKSRDIEFPEISQTLEKHIPFYQETQKQLNLLNVYASRINALRKELIRTQMRVQQKNRLFQKLSTLGDMVFPKRKELIQLLSHRFIEDISSFEERYFVEMQEYELRRQVFLVRKEIKALQSIAKILTLNTHAFSMTRERLSLCWDKLKGMEKELKKEFAEQKLKSAESVELVKQKIEAFTALSQERELSYDEGLREIEKIALFMRDVELTRYDVKMLKEMLSEARAPLETKREEERAVKKEREEQYERARQEKILAFKEQLEALKGNMATEQEGLLSQELEDLRKALVHLPITKSEKLCYERTLKAFRDQIAEKKGQALLSLSDADRAALEDLEKLHEELSQRRKEIKGQVEELRKLLGGSTLDFEKAIRYSEQMEAEKESLVGLDERISELNKKIVDLKQSTK